MSFHGGAGKEGGTHSEDMELAGARMLDLPRSFEATFSSTHLPHKAVYITFTIISVDSLILGIGRSSIAMTRGPLKTTAFIVLLAIVFPASYLGFSGFSGFLGFLGQ